MDSPKEEIIVDLEGEDHESSDYWDFEFKICKSEKELAKESSLESNNDRSIDVICLSSSRVSEDSVIFQGKEESDPVYLEDDDFPTYNLSMDSSSSVYPKLPKQKKLNRAPLIRQSNRSENSESNKKDEFSETVQNLLSKVCPDNVRLNNVMKVYNLIYDVVQTQNPQSLRTLSEIWSSIASPAQNLPGTDRNHSSPALMDFNSSLSPEIKSQIWVAQNEIDSNIQCDICQEFDQENGDEIVLCDTCNVGVHQSCYK